MIFMMIYDLLGWICYDSFFLMCAIILGDLQNH